MGNPSLPLPIIITLAFADSESLVVASIPFSCKILAVKEALNILLAVAFPSASILVLTSFQLLLLWQQVELRRELGPH